MAAGCIRGLHFAQGPILARRQDHGLLRSRSLARPVEAANSLANAAALERTIVMLLPRLILIGLLSTVTPLGAETPTEQPAAEISIASLGQALHLDALFEVLRDEGIAYGKRLETDMFPAGGGPTWAAKVSAIYDVPALRAGFEVALEAELAADPETLAEIIAFFSSDLGQRVVSLEIDARRAFLDTPTEEAARVAADNRFADRDPRVRLLRRFIEAGDLIEMNVAGSLSGNLAFTQGMSASGAYGPPLPEEQMLSDVWGQEDQTRGDITSWLYAYLGMAYEPLSDAEMESYIDFVESPAGMRLNAALFTAFDKVFRQVSQEMGRAAGMAMLGRDI
jgi:hypothetical protein